MTQIWSNVSIGAHTHAASDITSGTIAAARLPGIAGVAHNLAASGAPSVTDDSTAGYGVGSVWVWGAQGVAWECLSAAAGAAVWNAVGSGPSSVEPESSRWVGGNQASASTSAPLNGSMRIAPWFLPRGGRLDLSELDIEVTVAGSAGASIRIIVYGDSGAFLPSALLHDSGQIPADTAAIKAWASVVQLRGRVVWVGTVTQGAPTTVPTFRVWTVPSGYVLRDTTASARGLASAPAYQVSGVTGAPPSSISAAGLGASAVAPAVVGRVA